MKNRLFTLLNIKPSEAELVKQLFWVQFYLGVATSLLFTSVLTLFLATYPIIALPKVSLLAAGLLLAANVGYARLEAKLSAKKLLQVIILLSLSTIVFTWVEATFFSVSWLPFFLSAWNLVVYMVVGYAFWGIAAIIFNVRESKRIFSVVGSGDIPAKILGYAAVAVLAPVIGVINVMAISIAAFLVAYYYLSRFKHPAILMVADYHHPHKQQAAKVQPGFIEQFFQNKLIFVITGWSFIGFTIYTLLDYTFLTEIKIKFATSQELATFLGVFFAIGRVLAMFLKLLLTSRVLNRLGLTNSLLITPAALMFITGFILLSGNSIDANLLIFGMMVLFSEVLKSSIQEPAFFVLFQPLDPHTRLKGHLITKGYTLPFALLAVGIFAFIFRDKSGAISISLVCSALIFLLIVWTAIVFLIKKEYLRTVIQALQKGYFTGTQLFLNDRPVRDLLLSKTKSAKPKEVLLALELLERSGYKKINNLLLRELNNTSILVKKYVLSRIILLNVTAALPEVRRQLSYLPERDLKQDLIKALFYLSPYWDQEQTELTSLDPISKKAALLGLAARNEAPEMHVVKQEVAKLASGFLEEDKLLALEIISEAPHGDFVASLSALLQDPAPAICKKAIETVGKVQAFTLWLEATETAIKNKAIAALQKSVMHYGDRIFAPEYMCAIHMPDTFNLALIKTAGNSIGGLSTAYLLKFLQPENEYSDTALGALFRKKANLTTSGEKDVVLWMETKLQQCKRKLNLFPRLATHSSVILLAAAIKSEIKQDLQLILQAFALIYDRQRLERVLQLVNASGDVRISNAIEMLELSIPKRYFIQVNALLEFMVDGSLIQTENLPGSASILTPVIKEIITDPRAGFNVWTKSVALYLIPTLNDNMLLQLLQEPQVEDGNPLFSETKSYVLSQVEL